MEDEEQLITSTIMIDIPSFTNKIIHSNIIIHIKNGH